MHPGDGQQSKLIELEIGFEVEKKKICNKSRIEVVKTDGAESKRAVAIERTEREPRQVVNSREEFENRKLSEKVE